MQTHAERIAERLEEVYPDALCALEYDGDPWKLLIMARLSAQCTDKRVNLTCKTLFERYPDARSLADAALAEVEEIIRPCGLYHVKAKDIIAASRMYCEDFDGVLPDEMDELLRFPGVGRKVANLLLGDIFGKQAVVVDTHCIRLSERLGLVPEGTKDPVKIERILSEKLANVNQSDFCHRIVLFGREYCDARKPRCAECPLADLCPSAKGEDHT